MNYRKIVLRLALYIECSGEKPLLLGNNYREYHLALANQFEALGNKERREGRRMGRKLIREAPGLEKAAGHLVPTFSPVPRGSGKWRKHYEAYKRNMLLWSTETPLCHSCKMAWSSLPKRLWPTRELADQIRLKQGDGELRVYECPVNPGRWHLGH